MTKNNFKSIPFQYIVHHKDLDPFLDERTIVKLETSVKFDPYITLIQQESQISVDIDELEKILEVSKKLITDYKTKVLNMTQSEIINGLDDK